MALLEDLANKAKTKNSRILLPESTDPRVIEASRFISDQNLAQIVLFDEDAASSLGVDSINLKNEDLRLEYAQTLFELRKHKGVSFDAALEMLSSPSVCAMIALHRSEVDGVVTGAITPSQEVLSSALRIIGVSENSNLVSSLSLIHI